MTTQTPAGVTEEGSSIAPAGFHGVIDGLDEADYFAHPALSASGAKRLLPPGCPALYRWEREHPVFRQAFDFGHAAHAKVLGVGAELVIVQTTAKDGAKADAEDYRSKSAQQHRDEIRAEGRTPILAVELEQVDAMADAIRAHPIAGALFDPARGGLPEQSAFWHDERYDVERRARFDWLPAPHDGRMILPDLKTCASAEPAAFGKAVANYGYAVQATFYMDAVRDLGLAEDVAFVFVAIEKQAPYLVTVFELDVDWLRIGRTDTDRALAVFAECQATGEWPSYSSDVELISPPAWLAHLYEGAPA